MNGCQVIERRPRNRGAAKRYTSGMRHRVCSIDDIPADRGLEVVVDGRLVGLFRDDQTDGGTDGGTDAAADAATGGVIAIDGLCPHAGGPLATGYCQDGVVMCPWHGWQFELATGHHCSTPQITVERFPATVEGGMVYVELRDDAADAAD